MKKAMVLKDQNYDFLGIFLSSLCGVHCLITPFLLLYFPSIGKNFESPWIHALLMGLVGWAFYQSVYLHYKIHRSKPTLGFGILGFGFLLIVSVIEVFFHSDKHGHGHNEAHHDESFTLYLAIMGSVLLIVSHILNIRKCKCLRGKGTCSEDNAS